MKNKKNVLYSLIILLAAVINFPLLAQQKNGAQDSVKAKAVSTSQGPNGIVRTIKQDRKGNIWITSWEGVFKYDGKSFTNITRKVSSARFFSVLEDRKGNFWFASIGSGVYYYDAHLSARAGSDGNDGVGQGKSFQNFTTRDGLAGNEVTNIYEDKTGAIWFGTGNGASRYDGKSFRNLKMNEAPSVTQADSVYVGPDPVHAQADSVYVGPGRVHAQADSVYVGPGRVHAQADSVYVGPDPVHVQADSVYVGPGRVHAQADSVYVGPGRVHAQADSVHVSFYEHPLPKMHWVHNDVNAIIEDKTGKLWFGTRGYATVYDGKTFTTITNKDGKPFKNVRSIIKDKKGNIWLGGYDGLWRYDGTTFTNFSKNFVGNIYEDKKGNIWTSSERAKDKDWALSRYDEKTLTSKKPTVTTIATKPMIFGILEDNKGNIWFGDFDGVHRYDARLNDGVGQGKTITDFKSKEGQK
ncbi:MAG: two-component regulator propeller domain-containing protein [Chitinophagaceae bacterium]